MTTLEEFQVAIKDNPLEKTNWLVVADWFEDQGKEAHTSVIRNNIKYLDQSCEMFSVSCGEFCSDYTDLYIHGCTRCKNIAEMYIAVGIGSWRYPYLREIMLPNEQRYIISSFEDK